jgi:predicted AlkP superfamily pyrophosphatase or phosphodiesterase
LRPTLVLIVVGLTPRLIGPHTPHLARLAAAGALRPLAPVAPAVTCSVQASFMTGLAPRDHGIVGNGWLFRDLMEIWFWRQSNRLVAGEKIWEAAKRRDAAFTCANLFWWYNMAASHDIGLTPRPIYKADGRKLPDFYAKPASLHDEIEALLGPFPLFQFWGPMTSIASSRWIAAAARHVMTSSRPTLTLVYLPHLDYDLQRHGPSPAEPRVAAALREIDAVAGELIDDADRGASRRIVVLSEYGIVPVRRTVPINRALREAGFLAVRQEAGSELLDPVASQAFAVADHQLAHVYVAEPGLVAPVARLLESVPGISCVLDETGKRAHALDHPRSGELVALAEPDAWFTYYYWLDARQAPDFAATVEIHRKPGYDPAELLIDPAIRFPKFAIARRLLARRLGFRALLDVIPLDGAGIKGSHGLLGGDADDGPLVITSEPHLLPDRPFTALDVKQFVLDCLFKM